MMVVSLPGLRLVLLSFNQSGPEGEGRIAMSVSSVGIVLRLRHAL
jgi:hypothetical protein